MRRTLVEGNNITFHCDVTDGSPKPTISWYFGWTTTDKRVDPNYDQRFSFPTEEEWTITGVERRDKGKYRCIAENIAGKDELRFEISAVVGTFLLCAIRGIREVLFRKTLGRRSIFHMVLTPLKATM